MDDELKGRLGKYLDALEKGAKQAGEFAEAEIPATVKEWLVWYGVSHAIYALIFLGCAIASAVIATRVRKKVAAREDWADSDRNAAMAALWACRILVPGLLLIGFFFNGLETLKCVVAPRVVVIEKVADLVSDKQPKGK
jgi:hypothetical protein